jgi:hypothetical protein
VHCFRFVGHLNFGVLVSIIICSFMSITFRVVMPRSAAVSIRHENFIYRSYVLPVQDLIFCNGSGVGYMVRDHGLPDLGK